MAPNETGIRIRSESKGKKGGDWFGTNKNLVNAFETHLMSLLQTSQESGDLEDSKWRPSI